MTVTALHPERAAATFLGDLAERAVDQAQELAFLVRDEGPAAIGAWLDRHRIPQDTGIRLLVVALAAMVDIDATKDQMLAWVTWDEHLQPLAAAPPPAPALSPRREPAGREAPRPASPGRVTHRERRILDYAVLRARGFTQEQAADHMQVSRRTITRYEAALTGRTAGEAANAA
jgi:hypothetical protein